jgi:hypothetical protein
MRKNTQASYWAGYKFETGEPKNILFRKKLVFFYLKLNFEVFFIVLIC